MTSQFVTQIYALSGALSAQREAFVLNTTRPEMQRIVDKHSGSKILRRGPYNATSALISHINLRGLITISSLESISQPFSKEYTAFTG